MKKRWLIPSAVLSLVLCNPVLAKQVGEAVSDMGQVGESDPNGYKLMVISIGIIFTCAITLIGVTMAFMFKKKKPK